MPHLGILFYYVCATLEFGVDLGQCAHIDSLDLEGFCLQTDLLQQIRNMAALRLVFL